MNIDLTNVYNALDYSDNIKEGEAEAVIALLKAMHMISEVSPELYVELQHSFTLPTPFTYTQEN